jgi:hypothetical protein
MSNDVSKALRSEPRGAGEHSRRTEAGDTLVEVLLAIVILGLTSVAILVAFATSISGSAEHRSVATMDTVLRTAAEETITAIQQQSNAQFGLCPANRYQTLAANITLPTGWTMQMVSVQYWDTTTSPASFTTTGCVVSQPTAPQVNSPQLVTITVTSPSLVVSSPLSFAVDDPLAKPVPLALPATHLAFVESPTSTNDGTAFPVQVAVEDANNNPVVSDASGITLSITSGTGASGANLSNSCAGIESNGIVNFTGCSIATIGTGYTLTATDRETNTTTGNPLTSATSSPAFNITAAPASQLVFSPVAPGPGTAGSAIPNVAVKVEDSSGNVVTTVSGSVTVAIQSGSAQSSFTSGTTTVTVSNGVATFSNLIVNTAGTYTLTAAPLHISGTISSATSSSFVVGSGSAQSFAVANPGSQTAGNPFTDTITAIDGYGNIATSYTGAQTIAFSGPSNAPSTVTPTYPASVTFSAGVGSATGITLVDVQGTTLVAAQGSITGTSGSFTVTVGATNMFTVTTPGTQTAGTGFNDVITATDVYGNVATGYTGAQTISFSGPSSSPSGSSNTPTYPASVSFSAGVGTASGIILPDAQVTALTATQGSGTTTLTGMSGNFTVVPAAASALAFNPAAPGQAVVATAIPNVAVQVVDPFGNIVTSANGTVNMTASSSSLTGTTGVTLSSGVASFSNLILKMAGTYTLTATPSSISGVTHAVTSGSFVVAKVAATNIVTNTTPTLGSNATFTATVSGPSGGTTPTGTVTWSVSGTAGSTTCASTTVLTSGTATCTIAVNNAGTYAVADSYVPGADPNYLAATSATDTASVALTPSLLQIESKAGGTAGTIQTGDHLGVTFPVPISAASVCQGKTTSFNIAGTVTIQSNAAPTTLDDDLIFTPSSGLCGGNPAGFATSGSGTHAGYIDLGSKTFVSSTVTFGSSTLVFNATTNNIQVLLGGAASPSTGVTYGTVTNATGTYVPDSAILSSTGSVPASGSVSATNVFTVLQPTASAIASVTGANGTPGSGDQIVYTYSEQVDPLSIASGWSGSSLAETACFSRAASSSAPTVLTIETSTGCGTAVKLGTVSLGDTGSTHYIGASSSVTMPATMVMTTSAGKSIVTVTLGGGTGFTAINTATVWTWTPSAAALDLAGNLVSTSVSPVSSSKVNFSTGHLASEMVYRLRTGTARMLKMLKRVVIV